MKFDPVRVCVRKKKKKKTGDAHQLYLISKTCRAKSSLIVLSFPFSWPVTLFHRFSIAIFPQCPWNKNLLLQKITGLPNFWTNGLSKYPISWFFFPAHFFFFSSLLQRIITRLPSHQCRIQESLKKQLITEDRFNWKLPPIKDQDCKGTVENEDFYSGEILKYVGGVDLSFSKNDPSIACATLVVLDFSTLEVVHEVSTIVNLSIPYVPGFLAFREVRLIYEPNFFFFFFLFYVI